MRRKVPPSPSSPEIFKVLFVHGDHSFKRTFMYMRPPSSETQSTQTPITSSETERGYGMGSAGQRLMTLDACAL